MDDLSNGPIPTPTAPKPGNLVVEIFFFITVGKRSFDSKLGYLDWIYYWVFHLIPGGATVNCK